LAFYIIANLYTDTVPIVNYINILKDMTIAVIPVDPIFHVNLEMSSKYRGVLHRRRSEKGGNYSIFVINGIAYELMIIGLALSCDFRILISVNYI
jgi:hypothetical protein